MDLSPRFGLLLVLLYLRFLPGIVWRGRDAMKLLPVDPGVCPESDFPTRSGCFNKGLRDFSLKFSADDGKLQR